MRLTDPTLFRKLLDVPDAFARRVGVPHCDQRPEGESRHRNNDDGSDEHFPPMAAAEAFLRGFRRAQRGDVFSRVTPFWVMLVLTHGSSTLGSDRFRETARRETAWRSEIVGIR